MKAVEVQSAHAAPPAPSELLLEVTRRMPSALAEKTEETIIKVNKQYHCV